MNAKIIIKNLRYRVSITNAIELNPPTTSPSHRPAALSPTPINDSRGLRIGDESDVIPKKHHVFGNLGNGNHVEETVRINLQNLL